jgi:nucleoside-diphosphate-sugar epimerase
MKIVVVGGSGLIGPKLVTMLTGDGHDVVAASRRLGVDIVSGEGSGRSLESTRTLLRHRAERAVTRRGR